MPVPSFLASFADKAQSAINASPLAAHLPGQRPSSPDAAAQLSANEAAAQGGVKSHTFEVIHNQLRAFGQQYSSSTSPVQKIITAEKSVAIDFDSVARGAKYQSKELYTWGQSESEDVRDVTDRLAYLNFVQGSLASSLAVKLDAARTPFKALRDAEAALVPRRNLRAGLQSQLARLEHDQQKGAERKIAELKDQIRKAEADDQPQEKEVELLKRKAVRESERLKWEAVREYAEKLVLLSQAATPIIAALPTVPPSDAHPYTGAQATAAARASLQRALDNYKTGHINLSPQLAGADLARSDTRSFGESHASELSSMNSGASSASPGIPTTPPAISKPLALASPASHAHSASVPVTNPPTKTQSPPINPAALNQSPAPIPAATSSPPAAPVPVSEPEGSQLANAVPAVTPTIAETGVPISASPAGPGPARGSLSELRAAHSNASSPDTAHPPVYTKEGDRHESAGEEKKRLEAAQAADSQSPSAPTSESAEDEKKRLEREERERLERINAGSGGDQGSRKEGDEDLPPYQDL